MTKVEQEVYTGSGKHNFDAGECERNEKVSKRQHKSEEEGREEAEKETK